MNIGVTGTIGFVGGHVAELLASLEDCRVREFEGDIRMPEASIDFVRDLDAVIHLAGLNRAADYDILNANTLGTLNILNALKSTNPRARLVLASSFQVYRQWGNRAPIDEETPPDPQSIYGFSKKFAEDLCAWIAAESGMTVVVMRLSNVFGPGCLPGYNSVIATFIDRTLSDQAIQINGDGSSLRDYIFVSDVAESFRRAATLPLGSAFSVYNICSGRMISLRDIVSLVSRSVGRPARVEYRAQTGEEIAYDACSSVKAARDGILKIPLTEFEAAIDITVNEERRRRAAESS